MLVYMGAVFRIISLFDTGGFPSARQNVLSSMPNKSVKGTRRPLAVLKFGFLSRFGGFVLLSLAARPLP